MRPIVADLVRCPWCRHFPLELAVAEASTLSGPGVPASCETRCPLGESRDERAGPGCGRCTTLDIEQGVLACPECGESFEIKDGIARLLPERRAKDTPPAEAGYRWPVALLRPDAGNRSFTREVTLFRRLRPRLAGGGILLELRCRSAQTVRSLMDPEASRYVYIGVDSDLEALRMSRSLLRGDFIHWYGSEPPVRPASVDGLLMLGALRNLSEPREVLRRAIGSVRPGGVIALNELVRDGGVAAVHAVLGPSVSRAIIRREYSPLRAVLARRLRRRMRSSAALTRVVVSLDAVCLNTLGRLVPFFGPREVLVFAERRAGAASDRPVVE